MLKRWVLRWHLLTCVLARNPRGKAFQCFGAVTWKDLSSRVTLVLTEGVANSIPLILLRLYAPCALSETSSLVYSGAIVTHGISIFSVGYLRRHCTQDTWQLGIVSRKAVLVKPRQYGH